MIRTKKRGQPSDSLPKMNPFVVKSKLGFHSCLPGRVILGQFFWISTGGSRTHTKVTPCGYIPKLDNLKANKDMVATQLGFFGFYVTYLIYLFGLMSLLTHCVG